MATQRLVSRFLTTASNPSTFLTRAFSSSAAAASTTRAYSLPRFALRSLSAVHLAPATHQFSSFPRTFSTRRTPNSLSDGGSQRPSKETILLDGCDFEHWLVVVDPPPQEWTRDQIIDHYIKILAKFVGSEEEARMKIYSVSTRHYFAFGALISEELSYKVKEMEGIRWVLPDSYLDVRNKDYGGEPFIDGQAVPYDPKYHEEWVRNNQKAQERNRRNDRPRNADRSRNFERRQRPQGGFQNNPTPGGNMGGGMPPNQGGAPNAGQGQNMPPSNAGYPANNTGYPPNNAGYPPNNAGYPPSNAGYAQSMPPNNAGYAHNMPPNNAGYAHNTPPNNAGYAQNMPQNNPGFTHNVQPNMGGAPSSYGGQGSPGYQPNQGGGMPYQNNQMGGQQTYVPQSNVGGGGHQGQNVPGRDTPQY